MEVEFSAWSQTWKQKIKDKLPRLFISNSYVEDQQIDIDIFYSSHAVAQDTDGLEEPFHLADIFIPELAGWTEQNLITYRSVAKGDKSPKEGLNELRINNDTFGEEYRFYGHALRILSLLHKSRKPITFIDVPLNHQNVLRSREVPFFDETITIDKLISLQDPENFRSAITHIKTSLQQRGEIEKEREEYMAVRLMPQLKNLLNDYPHLKAKGRLRVLMVLGSAHTNVYRRLLQMADIGEETTRTFVPQPTIFSFGTEGIRRTWFGKEIDDLLASRVMIESILGYFFGRQLRLLAHNSQMVDIFDRLIATQFSYSEVEELVGHFGAEQDFLKVFNVRLQEKNLHIPSSNAELEAILQTRKVEPKTIVS